jgi:hemerythrin-like metal-binding protein
MFLNWDDNYSVSVKELDDQHKIWIGLINNLYDAIKIGKGNQAIDIIIDEVIRYTEYHFEFEENLLSKYGYPEEPNHKKTHDDFALHVRDIKKILDSGGLVKSNTLLEQMKNWLIDHILMSDKQYSDFLNSKGVY